MTQYWSLANSADVLSLEGSSDGSNDHNLAINLDRHFPQMTSGKSIISIGFPTFSCIILYKLTWIISRLGLNQVCIDGNLAIIFQRAFSCQVALCPPSKGSQLTVTTD